MKILVTSKLSKNMYETPQGYLVCKNAIFSRTGKQPYMKSEIYPDCDDDTVIEVDRSEKEVFSEEAMASFENMPLTNEHPYENVTPENYKEYAVGFVRDIHKGKFKNKPVMMGTIVITDPDAIEDVKNGKRDLSCGYDCDITEGDHPEQINIRGNHVALCEQGRAGIARIVDSADENYIPGYRERVVKNFACDAEMFAVGAAYDDAKGKQWKIVAINGSKLTLSDGNTTNVFEADFFGDMLAKKVFVPATTIKDECDTFINDEKTYVKYYMWPGAGYFTEEGIAELDGKYTRETLDFEDILADAYKKNIGYFVQAKDLTEEEEKEYEESGRFIYADLTMKGVDFVGYVCIENFKVDDVTYEKPAELNDAEETSFTLTFVDNEKAKKALEKFESDEMLKVKMTNITTELRGNEIKFTGDVVYIRALQKAFDEIYDLVQNSEEKQTYALKRFVDSAGYSQKFYKKLKKTLEENLEDLDDFEIILDDDDEEEVQKARNNVKRELRKQILNTENKLK